MLLGYCRRALIFPFPRPDLEANAHSDAVCACATAAAAAGIEDSTVSSCWDAGKVKLSNVTSRPHEVSWPVYQFNCLERKMFEGTHSYSHRDTTPVCLLYSMFSFMHDRVDEGAMSHLRLFASETSLMS